ncbi:MAG: hypothetical protein Q9212_002244 [Teloschistes hypoglaucus]
MADYEYTPIEDNTIRILTLLPGQPSHDIRIQLKTIDLNVLTPEYEALSYAWGSSAKPNKVVVVAPFISSYRGQNSSPRIKSRSSDEIKKPSNPVRRVEFLDKATNTVLGDLAVTENLATALRHLRWTAKTRDLWIDAICINQQNFAERGAQVAMMGSIYANASQVLVWLGPENIDSALAVETLSSIAS